VRRNPRSNPALARLVDQLQVPLVVKKMLYIIIKLWYNIVKKGRKEIMSSWTLETYNAPHSSNANWHIMAEYSWNKCQPYSVFVGVFDNKGNQIETIFKGYYSNVNSAKLSFKRQVRKLKQERRLGNA
jgi:hypothetical protein